MDAVVQVHPVFLSLPQPPSVLSPSDRSLAMRLEAAESGNIVALAKAAIAHTPTNSPIQAAFESFAGGTAVFAGVGSPMTHALGIGLSGDVPEAELERMEGFFRDRGSPCLIDLCPLADPSVIAFVQSRPYRVIEFNNVLARRIEPEEDFGSGSRTVRLAEPQELAVWTRVVMEGFSEGAPILTESLDFLSGMCSESNCWIAENLTGGAAMAVRGDTALFYGDAVFPSARRAGLQSAMIRSRLASAQSKGCNLAMVSVVPGSGSHRNYERAGFQLIYMRVNLTREFVV